MKMKSLIHLHDLDIDSELNIALKYPLAKDMDWEKEVPY